MKLHTKKMHGTGSYQRQSSSESRQKMSFNEIMRLITKPAVVDHRSHSNGKNGAKPAPTER
jgi:hypothetical protein